MVEYTEQPPRLVCVGDEDRNTHVARLAALHRARKAGADVIVELGGLTFADTSLMIDLATLSQRLRRRGSMLVLRSPSIQTMLLINTTGLNRLPGVELEYPSATPA